MPVYISATSGRLAIRQLVTKMQTATLMWVSGALVSARWPKVTDCTPLIIGVSSDLARRGHSALTSSRVDTRPAGIGSLRIPTVDLLVTVRVADGAK